MRVAIPSVDYADFLAVTLPACLAAVPAGSAVVVVTAPRDEGTQRVAREAGVDCHVTDAWTRDGAVFDKAAALDEAFGMVGERPAPDLWEPCLSLDADCYLVGRVPTDVEAGVLYGCPRYHARTPDVLRDHLAGKTSRADLELVSARALADGYEPIANTKDNARAMAAKCLGYFQLFRYQPGVQFGRMPTASLYDLRFRAHFARRVGLLKPYVLHLGEQRRANWSGRVVPAWEAAACG